MGFGHRIYKTDDPRSLMLRGVAERLGGDMVDFAKQVEKTVVDVLAELKPGRNLYANVEFYAGVVMDKVGPAPQPVHAHVHVEPGHRLDGPHPRAGGRQPPHPAAAPTTTARRRPSRCPIPTDAS